MSLHRRVYKWRGKLASLPLIVSLMCFHEETEAQFIWIIGLALFLLGWLVRVWAQQHLHYRLKASMCMTSTGPYAFVRNPVYIGNTLICLAAICISELVWLVPFTLLWCMTLYSLVVRCEERHLIELYGEPYREYLSKVPRWFPAFRRMDLKNLTLINEHLCSSVLAEIGTFLIILPFVLKEILYP